MTAPTLRDQLDEYLVMRRALGFQLDDLQRQVGSFLAWLEARGQTQTFTIDEAVTWARLNPKAHPSWWATRLSLVRRFTNYLHANGIDVPVIPTGLLPARKPRAVPFIYSQEDIDALLAACGTAFTDERVAFGAERDACGSGYLDHGLVFSQIDGTPLRPSGVTAAFEAHVISSGLPSIRLHDTRHGACSLLLAGGVPIDVVQMILGHSSPAVTRQVYAHILRKATALQVEAAAELVDVHRREHSANTLGALATAAEEGFPCNSRSSLKGRGGSRVLVSRVWGLSASLLACR
jgi:site-specific recombinase XerD